MKLKYGVLFVFLMIFSGCAFNNESSTPTIVPLEQKVEATPINPPNLRPTPTPIPMPSPTPTPTPLALSTLTTPTPSVTANPVGPRAEVIVPALNIRAGPGLDYAVIGGATQGEQFKVVGVDPTGEWLQIVTEAESAGWISAGPSYTRLLSVDLNELPFVEPPASEAASPAVVPAAQTAAMRQDDDSLSGQLIFSTGSGGDLYRINLDGTDLRHLTGGVLDPMLSPDGRRIAFTRWDGAEFGALYTIDVDGSNERAIVGDIRQARWPAWSPDGTEIMLSFQHGGLRDPEEECRHFDYDDGIRLPDDIGEITSFKITGDDISICYIRKEDLQWSLRRVEVATGQFEDQPVDLYSYTPAWDPQNDWRVIYDGAKGLMELDVTTGQNRPFTTDIRDRVPVFSPDGSKLALTYKQHDHWEVYTVDLATGQRQRLTKPPILADPQYNSVSPAWSPDGEHIAFLTDRNGPWEMWVMQADGSRQRPLFPDRQFDFELQYDGMHERMLAWTE